LTAGDVPNQIHGVLATCQPFAWLPRAAPLRIIEFTVFGKPAGPLPATEPIPESH
jgi:hypothetical protein